MTDSGPPIYPPPFPCLPRHVLSADPPPKAGVRDGSAHTHSHCHRYSGTVRAARQREVQEECVRGVTGAQATEEREEGGQEGLNRSEIIYKLYHCHHFYLGNEMFQSTLNA